MLYKNLISTAKNPCFWGRRLEKVELSRLVAAAPRGVPVRTPPLHAAADGSSVSASHDRQRQLHVPPALPRRARPRA